MLEPPQAESGAAPGRAPHSPLPAPPPGAEVVRIGASRLTAYLHSAPGVAVAAFAGCADESGIPTLVEASEALVGHEAPRIALDFSRLSGASAWCAHALARAIAEAHRQCKEAVLVRCPGWLFEELQRHGTAGPVRHAGSLAAATDGALGDPCRTLALNLRSDAALLPRVGTAVSSFLAAHGYAPEQVEAARAAVLPACAHAVEHRSPQGLRNQVRVAVHAEPDALILEITDQGEPPNGKEPPWDACLAEARAAVDDLEMLPDSAGTVWRFTQRCCPPSLPGLEIV